MLAEDPAISVSDALVATTTDPRPNWVALELLDAGGHPVPGPYLLAAWDPTGERLAVLASPSDELPRLVIADAASGRVTLSVMLEAQSRSLHPVWVGPDTLAVQSWDVSAELPVRRSILVDAQSGVVADGPARGAWAGSPDGSLVLTDSARRPGNGPFSVQSTESWLAGDEAELATLAEPEEEGAYLGFAFDASNQRAVLTWVSGNPDRVSEHVYAASAGWAEVAVTPSRDRNRYVGVAWLP